MTLLFNDFDREACGVVMREKLVAELVKDVLGPRGGIYEVLRASPLNEYITGVLAPVTERPVLLDIDSSAELPTDDVGTYEEGAEESDVFAPPLFYPALDPKRRPSTFGLSFVVESEDVPKAAVCLTWARYVFSKDESGKPLWRRQPRSAIFHIDLDKSKVLWIDGNGRQVKSRDEAEISFHVVTRKLAEKRYLVNLYFVNRIKPPEGEEPNAEHHIFQPQIRVVLEEGARLVPRTRRSISSEEELELEFLYRKRPVLARGHLCSAVWRDVDPENAAPGIKLDFPECRNEPPFAWVDGALLPEEQRKRFSPPDVRTEFVPVYSVPFPDLRWPDEYGVAPELNAAVLAETWNPESLRKALMPLCEGYQRWIEAMEQQADRLSEEERKVAQKLIERCRAVLKRISRGIDILCSDSDARLAFCFANKAIDLQWKWQRNTDFMWRPFQLAFILLCIESIVDPESEDRDVCDLLWVPTGAGKTEAYLALIAFTIAMRRRKARRRAKGDRTGAGVTVIMRYTLRLLTIQQFRRALSLIAACEYLRVYNLMGRGPVGWRPSSCEIKEDFIWGSTPFSIGLWVGGGLSPNRLWDTPMRNFVLRGALSILKGEPGEGEPAQVLNCPACGAILAVPDMGLRPSEHTIHFVVYREDGESLANALQNIINREYGGVRVTGAHVFDHASPNYHTLTLKIKTSAPLMPHALDDFWRTMKEHLEKECKCRVELASARASRPGYFIRHYVSTREKKTIEYDFEIFCPNPDCPLRVPWVGGAPAGWVCEREPSLTTSPDGFQIPMFMDGNRLIEVQGPFMHGMERQVSRYVSDRIPIPAMTVDEQVCRRLPTVIVATVDKFARPPFEPFAGAIFGNVEYHHCLFGYYRLYQPACQHVDKSGHPVPAGTRKRPNYVQLKYKPDPPELIIQDELHLIEGPLGSLVGIYETAIDYLCSENGIKPKYIASTATIRRAEEQVRAIFLRGLRMFPPHGLDAGDRFFVRESEMHALEDRPPGRLYMGICAPGRGPLTPLVRIFARLLQTVWQLKDYPDVDRFWTLTGYFNAIRELAGARALYRQDIPQRINEISGGYPRPLREEGSVELSSRTPSTDLPAIIDLLNRSYPHAPDVLFTTSMFGTGVDIPRIGLMVVDGQPKTTSAYIQSTGRVGRSKGALVVTFFRATRPRDLSHYEFFIGYHRQLHRFVEPPTVYPFSTGVLDRALGAVMVFLLRNMRKTSIPWHKDDSAPLMRTVQSTAPEISTILKVIEERASGQPPHRIPLEMDVKQYAKSELERWQLMAARHSDLRYVEYAIATKPSHPVVLGDFQHQHAGLGVVYENVPNSLRDIEETTGFQT
jgi:hypothetical protein